MGKPKVAIFSLTCCDGCQVRILDVDEAIIDVLGAVDIVAFPLGTSGSDMKGPYDIAFVEGSVVNKDDATMLKDIRSKTKVLVALGTCAVFGGVQSIRNFGDDRKIKSDVYGKKGIYQKHTSADGLDKYVKVDFCLKGCPIEKSEFVTLVKEVLAGKKRLYENERSVCYECRMKGNECLLEKGERCMGPVTFGGCDAVCTSNGYPCYGCRGTTDDANPDAHIDILLSKGFDKKDICRGYIMFAGESKNLSGVYKRLGVKR